MIAAGSVFKEIDCKNLLHGATKLNIVVTSARENEMTKRAEVVEFKDGIGCKVIEKDLDPAEAKKKAERYGQAADKGTKYIVNTYRAR
jgi:hypothetical protein